MRHLSGSMPYLWVKLASQNWGRLIRFWLLALVLGIAAGLATVGFRAAISALQELFYGADDLTLASALVTLPWWIVVSVPIAGGLVVGWILNRYTPDGRARTVAHVIEGAALRNGRVEGRAGLASAAASLITLSTGGSTGREGPVVHLAAVLSSKVSRWINADGITARDLMGCAVAAAVSASFNAPIAGAIFAMELVLRHFALHAFAPIVVAAVSGAVIARLTYWNFTEFTLAPQALSFYVELPAFLILGLICGLVATVFIAGIFWAEDLGNKFQERFKIHNILRPGIAGAMLGVIALAFPHIIGVGYETTSRALAGDFLFWNVIVLAVIKAVAVAITMAGRMGGGVFSPSLMLGALTGLAFGLLAASVFPSMSSTQTLYALAGMGAVAAAVLGAPISTTLIVFELSGDWQTALAVMVAVSISSTVSNHLSGRSFFLSQLERRNIYIALGPQDYLPKIIPVSEVMRKVPKTSEKKAWRLIDAQVYLRPEDGLDTAMALFESAGHKHIPVIALGAADQPPELLGLVRDVDVLKRFNAALTEAAREEHS